MKSEKIKVITARQIAANTGETFGLSKHDQRAADKYVNVRTQYRSDLVSSAGSNNSCLTRWHRQGPDNLS
jgi:hypothetical protein